MPSQGDTCVSSHCFPSNDSECLQPFANKHSTCLLHLGQDGTQNIPLSTASRSYVVQIYGPLAPMLAVQRERACALKGLTLEDPPSCPNDCPKGRISSSSSNQLAPSCKHGVAQRNRGRKLPVRTSRQCTSRMPRGHRSKLKTPLQVHPSPSRDRMSTAARAAF